MKTPAAMPIAVPRPKTIAFFCTSSFARSTWSLTRACVCAVTR